MTEMVERTAKALCKADPYPRSAFGNDWGVWTAMARAAIEGMREPTPEMIEAGAAIFKRGRTNVADRGGEVVADYIWRAMIEAAMLKT